MVSASAQGAKRFDCRKLEADELKILNQPIELSPRVSAQNCFLKAALTERISSWDQNDPSKRGVPSEELIKVYEQWGRGGYGIILSGNTMVNQVDLEGAGNATFGGDEPERLEAFKMMASVAQAHGSLYVVQLSHAGRQVGKHINPNPVSASDVQLLDGKMGQCYGKPEPLSIEGIKEFVNSFASAAEYAYKTGADGVQLHASHGYLLAQFLAPTTNKRTDQYGGSLENRSRIIFEIIDEIKKRIPSATKEFILDIKINSMEFQEGGFRPEECRDVVSKLAEEGVTFIELSGGTYETMALHKRESTKKREAFFLEFSDVVVKALPPQAKTWVTGGFRTAPAMVSAIQSGSTHGIGLGRPITVEFDLPKKLLSGEVSSAINSDLDESDYAITGVASGTQMYQVGRGVQPFDSSDEPQVAKFESIFREFGKKAHELGEKGIVQAGYPIMN